MFKKHTYTNSLAYNAQLYRRLGPHLPNLWADMPCILDSQRCWESRGRCRAPQTEQSFSVAKSGGALPTTRHVVGRAIGDVVFAKPLDAFVAAWNVTSIFVEGKQDCKYAQNCSSTELKTFKGTIWIMSFWGLSAPPTYGHFGFSFCFPTNFGVHPCTYLDHPPRIPVESKED